MELPFSIWLDVTTVFLVEMHCCILFPAAQVSWGKITLSFMQSYHVDCLDFSRNHTACRVAKLP